MSRVFQAARRICRRFQFRTRSREISNVLACMESELVRVQLQDDFVTGILTTTFLQKKSETPGEFR
jgi:hypothetical protein